jgi:hypothetical protein
LAARLRQAESFLGAATAVSTACQAAISNRSLAAVPIDAALDGSDSADDEPVAAAPSKPAATNNPKVAALAKKKAVHKDWFKNASDIEEILHFVRLNGGNVITAISKLCSLPHGCF